METYFTREDGTVQALPKAPAREGWKMWTKGVHRCGVCRKRVTVGVSLRDGRHTSYRCAVCSESVIDHLATAVQEIRRLGVQPIYGDRTARDGLGWV